ncbi:hypothetical protein K503DRAFT_406076 [Rhizopogon vinicolor AM-OR11-026]|uniref:Uncharacterized protein n=1 Tax=Rhizopogon vinicolor AM-OR11-026 TaxID=1314800 RepID=A0A1B7MQS1_9AGAM|nr:hypothetical protein K503DRAFT_406076 [Rhizopogon vinicolor AM-OR11-026]
MNIQCVANETAVATFSKISLATYSRLLVTKSAAMSHLRHTLVTFVIAIQVSLALQCNFKMSDYALPYPPSPINFSGSNQPGLNAPCRHLPAPKRDTPALKHALPVIHYPPSIEAHPFYTTPQLHSRSLTTSLRICKCRLKTPSSWSHSSPFPMRRLSPSCIRSASHCDSFVSSLPWLTSLVALQRASRLTSLSCGATITPRSSSSAAVHWVPLLRSSNKPCSLFLQSTRLEPLLGRVRSHSNILLSPH